MIISDHIINDKVLSVSFWIDRDDLCRANLQPHKILKPNMYKIDPKSPLNCLSINNKI
jgi:hypothetical protein